MATRKAERTLKPSDTGARVGELTSELGTTGLEHYGGVISEEFLPQLEGERGRKVYREMSDNDPIVGAVLFVIEMLIRQVVWDVEPAGTEQADDDNAEFLKQCMDDMDRPWTELISEVLTMLPHGYSLHELVYKLRRGPGANVPSDYDDGKVGWRRMPIRGQDTVDCWHLSETGEVDGVQQVAPPDYQTVDIPYYKLIHFRTTSRKGNPEGRSILRNAYRPWFFKKKIEEGEGIGVERDLAGIPVAYVPPHLLYESAGAADKALLTQIKKIVRNIKNDQQAGIIFPLVYDEKGNQLYKFELLTTAGTRVFDTNAIIQRYDQRIAMTVLADFILLGHEKVGSFALSSSKTSMFATALGAWLDSIVKTFNRDAVPRLFQVNGWTGALPKIVHGDIETPDLKELGEYISRLSGAGAMLFPDDKLERQLLRLANLEKEE